jgi:hypothetical protein
MRKRGGLLVIESTLSRFERWHGKDIPGYAENETRTPAIWIFRVKVRNFIISPLGGEAGFVEAEEELDDDRDTERRFDPTARSDVSVTASDLVFMR